MSICSDTLTITKAYELAIKNANELKSTNYQYKSIKESVNQQKAGLLPQVNLSASYGKNDYELNRRQDRADYSLGGDTKNYSLSITQSIYDKEMRTKVDLELVRSKLYKLKVNMLEQDLAKRVLASYLEVMRSLNKIELYSSYITHNKSMLDSIKSKFDMDLANKMDLLQMEVKYNSSKIDLQKEKELFKAHQMQLSHLIGGGNYSFPRIDFKKINYSKLQNMYTAVSSVDNGLLNLESQQALQGLELAKKEVAYAKSGHMPKINLEMRYTKYSQSDETAYYDNTKLVALNIKVPIYQGGYVKSKVLSSRFNKLAAEQDLINVQSQIRVEYKKLLLHFNASLKSIKLYKEAYISAKVYMSSVNKGYKSGLKSIVDLNEAQSNLYDVKYKYMQNLYDMLDVYVGLLVITNSFNSLSLINDIVD
jgi:outer membrane protein